MDKISTVIIGLNSMFSTLILLLSSIPFGIVIWSSHDHLTRKALENLVVD